MTGSSEQVNGVEPRLQRRAAILERSADSRMQMIAAPLAGISTFGLYPIPLGLALALRADMALTEAHVKKVIQAGLVVRELLEELFHRHTGFLVSHA